jgi:hypothetical protein
MNNRKSIVAVTALVLAIASPFTFGDDTAFTYQGSLSDAGSLANGTYSMTFTLFGSSSGGAPLGTVTIPSVSTTGGLFDVELDFGPSAYGVSDRWIEITIDGSTLSPRQEVKGAPYSIQTRGIHVDDAGRVGLGGGTITSELLTLADPDANILMLSQGNDFGPKITLRNTASGIATTHGRLIFDDGGQRASIGYVKPLGVPAGLSFGGANGEARMKITDDGRIGFGGELNPLAPMHMSSADIGLSSSHFTSLMDFAIESSDATIGLFSSDAGTYGSVITFDELSGGALVDKWSIGRTTSNTGAASTLFFKYGSNPTQSANPSRLVLAPNGDVGIGVSVPQARFHVDGDARIDGNARVDVLEVVGADLAEKFPTIDGVEIEPGLVLEIDPDNPGMVRIATSAYSGLVAGIVSGANGLPAGTIMGNLPGMDDATPIALSGRVWVHCDTSDSAIEPGDLLTTSATPGHAMRASDRQRAIGAIIGKAMTSLEQGEQGMVLVLVGLQ